MILFISMENSIWELGMLGRFENFWVSKQISFIISGLKTTIPG